MKLVRSIGYLVLEVTDIAQWRSFVLDILGMQLSRQHADGALGFRADDYEQRLILVPGGNDEMLACGWELPSEGELNELVAHMRACGQEVTAADPALLQARGVARMYHCADPVLGFRHELYCGPRALGPTHPFQSPLVTGGFKTGVLGLGHMALTTTDNAKSLDFFQRILGLGISNYADVDLPNGAKITATFFFAQGGRHHYLALLPGTNPKPTRHLMIEYQQLDDVGLAYERCKAAGVPIERSLGVHEGDGMFSFYATTPSGYLFEIGYGGLTGTDWNPVTLSALSRWGHTKP